MIKTYPAAEINSLIEEAPITYFGCPFHLNVDKVIIDMIVNNVIWNAPYRALIFTNSHLFTLSLIDKLKVTYDAYSYDYEYDDNYCFYDKSDKGDKKSEIQVFNFSSKKTLNKKVKKGYYDRAFFHFVDENIKNYLEEVILSAKALSFFTLDSNESLFYELGEDELEHFYRLYDDKSNKEIENFEKNELIDLDEERLIKGLFIKK